MIPMLQDFEKIRFLVGTKENMEKISDLPVFPSGSQKIIDFLSDLSASILKHRLFREFPEIVGYAYWIRKANMLMESRNIQCKGNRLGRGISFHIAPSNIPIQFAISMVPALLAGNSCIIRVSGKRFAQTEILCEKINAVLKENHADLIPYINIIQYNYSDELTAYFSDLCDVRIIWGGDETVKRIRKYPIRPRTVELTFADRFSIAIINSKAVSDETVYDLINKFWLDTYFIDQNACSSPRLIAWTGDKTNEARNLFWKILEQKTDNEYRFESVQVINKFDRLANCAMSRKDVKICENTGAVTRLEIGKADPQFFKFKEGGGYFFEYICNNLTDLLPILKDSKCQTVAVFGENIADIKKMVFEYGTKGVERIVSIGKTTYPNLRWDGYCLTEMMSRYIEAEEST